MRALCGVRATRTRNDGYTNNQPGKCPAARRSNAHTNPHERHADRTEGESGSDSPGHSLRAHVTLSGARILRRAVSARTLEQPFIHA